jgi:hypothetical protein
MRMNTFNYNHVLTTVTVRVVYSNYTHYDKLVAHGDISNITPVERVASIDTDVEMSPREDLGMGASSDEGWTKVQHAKRRKTLRSNDNNESRSPTQKRSKEKRRDARASVSRRRRGQKAHFQNERALPVCETDGIVEGIPSARYIGVKKHGVGWYAYFMGEAIAGGPHDEELKAALCYDDNVMTIKGEDAVTNFSYRTISQSQDTLHDEEDTSMDVAVEHIGDGEDNASVESIGDSEDCASEIGQVQQIKRSRDNVQTKRGVKRHGELWLARLTRGGVDKLFGPFKTQIEASIAYEHALLITNPAQGQSNARLRGVYKSGSRWSAVITRGSVEQRLGTFDTQAEASVAFEAVYGLGPNVRFNLTEFHGVSKMKHKWWARMSNNGKIVGGPFTTPIEAAKCHDAVVRRIHGSSKAVVNFTIDGTSTSAEHRAQSQPEMKKYRAVYDRGHGWVYRIKTAGVTTISQLYRTPLDASRDYEAERLRVAQLSGASSRYRGVFRISNKWGARMGRKVDLGVFNEEKDAARAVDVAATVAWGDAAVLNFNPDGTETTQEHRATNSKRQKSDYGYETKIYLW